MGAVGKSIPRAQARQFVAGRGRYLDDVRIPGVLHAVFLRSPYAHAAIDRLDLTAARAAAGVVAAFDGAQIGAVCPSWTAKFATMPQHHSPPQPPLATDRAVWQGQPVAMVIAESRALAEDAIARIEIEWSEREPLADAGAAPDAEPLHPGLSNVGFEQSLAAGDPDRAFAAADRVVRRRLRFARHTGVPLESRGIVADFDPGPRRLTVHQSTQVPHQMRSIYAELFGLAEPDVRVIVPDVGGAFGVKLHCYDDEVAVVAASMLLGRPVKWTADRLESFVSDIHARGHAVEAAIAVKADGTILGFEVDDVMEMGAYSIYPRGSVGEGLHAVTMTGAPYAAPALKGRLRAVFQTKAPVGSYRGVGQPIGCGITEHLVEEAARELGIDPAEMRRRNYRRPGIDPAITAGGVHAGDLSHHACLEKLLEAMDYAGLRAKQAAARVEGRRLGIGLAAFVEVTAPGTGLYGAANVKIASGDGCVLRLEPSGTITCITSVADQGQGADTGMRQLIADALGLAVEQVRIIAHDTAVTPVGGGTWASRGLVVGGEAALTAVNLLRDRLRIVAGAVLGMAPEAIAFADGNAVCGEKSVALASLADRMHFRQHELPPEAQLGPVVSADVYPKGRYLMANGIQASLVEVDVDTGFVTPLGHWVVEDCGRVINPLLADEQLRGGVVQGLGEALFEECRYDERGQLLNATLADYLVPMALDMPDVVIAHVETPVAGTLLGAKGIGEAGTIGAGAALLNAVNDALAPLGARLGELPCTPERVLRALDERGGAA